MASRHARLASVEDAVQELFAEFLARRSDEHALDFEEFARAHPEHSERLRELHAGWDEFELELASLGARARAIEFHGELAPGQEIGDFRLLERIASGGMGQDWAAHQLSIDRRVALKVMKPERATERGRLFFEREARAGGRLAHRGLVSIYAAGEDEGVHWIAMELGEGGCTLRDTIHELREHRELPSDHYEWVASLFSQICDAVQAAHDCKVIHRDIKPSNVLITPEGEPKITDFGLARIVDELALSRTGEFAGTYFYMSPEQVTARRIGIDHRTDVFSLGVVLYEVLTLRRPFEGETGHQVAESILYDEPRDPRRIGAEVPAPLAWICGRAIEKRRADRYPSMRAFGDDLQRFLVERKPKARPAGPWRKLRRWSRRRPALATGAGLGAALVAVSLLLGLVILRAGAEKRRERWEALLDRITMEALYGELDAARASAEEAVGLFPAEPEPHLVLAVAFMGAGQVHEAQRELDRATEFGVEEREIDESDPDELTRRAMRRFARGDWLSGADFEVSDLERALELDERQVGAWSLLYYMELAAGDHAAAAAALRRLRGWMPPAAAPELQRLFDGLEREAEGDMAGAIRTFEALLSDATLDPERRAALPVYPPLGRAYLVQALQGDDPSALDHAQAAFERAIETIDDDLASRVNLAWAHALRMQRAVGPDSEALVRDSLDAARELLDQVFAALPHHVKALEVAWELEVAALVPQRDALPPPPAEVWEPALELLGRLRARAPESASLANAQAWVECLTANALVGEGAWDEVAVRVERCLELDPGNFWALGLGTQAAHSRAQYEAGIELANRGEAVWEELDERMRDRWGAETHADLHVWRLWNANDSGRPELFASSRAAVESSIEAGFELSPLTLINFAELLARATAEEARDCARVRELFEHGSLAEWLAGPDCAEGVREYVQDILDDCGS